MPHRRRRPTAGKRGRIGGKSLDIRIISEGNHLRCGTGALRAASLGEADFLPEEEEAEGLLNAAQGDMEGVDIFSLAEEAVQAGLQDIQPIQEMGDLLLPDLAVLVGQGPVEMLEMAGKGRGREAELSGQGAQGEAVHEGAVDLPQGGVSADGAASIHGVSVFDFRFSVIRKRIGGKVIRERGKGPAWVGKMTGNWAT